MASLPGRILLIRLSAIGDVVRVLPAASALRAALPGAQIDFAVESKSADLVRTHHAFDHVHVFDRSASGAVPAYIAFCRDIRRARYEAVVDFHGILKSGLVCACSGASARYGFSGPRSQEGSAFFTNRRTAVPRDELNRIEENFRLAESVTPLERGLRFELNVPETEQAAVRGALETIVDTVKCIVAIHAPVDRPEKQWPMEHFAALADLLASDGRFAPILTWGPGQRRIADAVATRMKTEARFAPETRNLMSYAALIGACGMYVGGDTGPMHIASAMDTPVVAIFGGTRPAQHRTLHDATRVLWVDPAERPTLRVAERLASIRPEAVYEACVELTDESRSNP